MPATPFVKTVLGDTPYIVSFSDDLGHTWSADEPTEVGGGNTATSPDRLILAGLGACTAITLRMVAACRQIPLAGVEVAERVQLLKVAIACPMHKLLTGEIRVHTELFA